MFFVFSQRFQYSYFIKPGEKFFSNSFFLLISCSCHYLFHPRQREQAHQNGSYEIAHTQFHQFSLHLQNIFDGPFQAVLIMLSVTAADARASRGSRQKWDMSLCIDCSTGKPLPLYHPDQAGTEQKLSRRTHRVPALRLTKNIEVALTRIGN